ncbi:hypothetical protein HDU76_000221 [Blyttiomyces sp. JEL0837]|nr:hypothetical protein HDU76_000221 [Blyttiomyces sp. JEL0837]
MSFLLGSAIRLGVRAAVAAANNTPPTDPSNFNPSTISSLGPQPNNLLDSPFTTSQIDYTPTAAKGALIPSTQLQSPINLPISQPTSQQIQVGGIIAPKITPNNIEVTFAVEPGYTSLIQGYNGLGSWKVAGILRVKNRSGKPLVFDHIGVELDVSMGGRFEKNSKNVTSVGSPFEVKVVNFEPVVLARKHSLNDAEIYYGRFEFLFTSSMPPTFNQPTPTGIYFRYTLTAQANTLNPTKKSSSQITTNEHIHELQIPHYNPLLVMGLTSQQSPITTTTSNPHYTMTATIPSQMVFPKSTIEIMVSIQTLKPIANFVLAGGEVRFIESCTNTTTGKSRSEIRSTAKIHTPSTFIQSIQLKIPLNVPDHVANVATGSLSYTNFDGIWNRSLLVSHSIKIVVVGLLTNHSVHADQVPGVLELDVVVPSAGVGDCGRCMERFGDVVRKAVV